MNRKILPIWATAFLLGVSLFGSHVAALFFTQAQYFDHYWQAAIACYAASAVLAVLVAWAAARSRRPELWLSALLALNLYLVARVRLAGIWPTERTGLVALALIPTILFLAVKKFGVLRLRSALLIWGFVYGFSSVGADLVRMGGYAIGGTGKTLHTSSAGPAAGASTVNDLHVFHIILDAMSGQETLTDPVIQESSFYGDAPSGIYYSNAFSNGHWTWDSLPQVQRGSFFKSEYPAPPLNSSLFKAGYEVNTYSAYAGMGCKKPFHHCYDRQWTLAHEIYGAEPLGMLQYTARRLLHAYFARIDAPRLDEWFFSVFSEQKIKERRTFDDGDTVNTALFRKFVENLRHLDRPSYNYVHLLLPHPPYLVDDECRTYGDTSDLEEGFFSEWSQGYTQQLRCANKLIKNFVRELQAKGLYDKSLIVVQSDHGKGFGEAHYRDDVDKGKDGKNPNMDPKLAYETRMHSVLWIKPPGSSKKEIRKHLAMTIDVPATIRAAAGLDLAGQQGLDLLNPDNNAIFDKRELVVIGLRSRPGRFFLRRNTRGEWSKISERDALLQSENRFLPLQAPRS